MTPTETLEALCKDELLKQLLRRTKKLQFILANRERFQRHFKKLDSVSQLLSLSRLTKREERMSDLHFDCLDYAVAGGRLQSKVNARRFVKRAHSENTV